jgi:hypothetical protein
MQIGEISGNLPTHLDIGSIEAWSIVSEAMSERPGKLIQSGRFRLVDFNALEQIRTWTVSGEVYNAIVCNPRVTHGDQTVSD